jgi:hypothetical protein
MIKCKSCHKEKPLTTTPTPCPHCGVVHPLEGVGESSPPKWNNFSSMTMKNLKKVREFELDRYD